MAGVTTRSAKGVPLTANDYDGNLEAMISLHKGDTEPSPTYACMLWADTQNTLLKMRNTANDGWVTLGALNTNDAFGGISDLVEDTTPQLGGDLGTNGNDITFGDNDKAIFGAGSDLQIFHNGSNSYISDEGTGDLYLRGANSIYLSNSDGTETYARFQENDAVRLYYDNAEKLATTSTGIDVTGTVTADAAGIGESSPGATLELKNSDQNPSIFRINNSYNAGGSAFGIDFYRNTDSGNDLAVSYVKAQRLGGNATDLVFGTTDTPGTVPERMRIDYNGDIKFYEDTGTTAKFFWDASTESLGIGIATPAVPLHVKGTNNSNVMIVDATGTSPNYIFDVRDNGISKFRVDPVGNVGIGTTSPSKSLQVQSSSSENGRTLRLAYDGTYYADIAQLGAGGVAYRAFGGLQHIFESSGSERMRIDSSGNLLVGKTSLNVANDGIELQNDGSFYVTKDIASGSQVSIFNRKTSDGKIIDFRKDGVTVGSIGAEGNDLTIESTTSNHAGLRFGGTAVLPRYNGALADNAVDLGQRSTNYRFKDLYLSGGVYLGGTVAANYLDDYEEGTFTPTGFSSNYTASTATGRYTKVGRMVHIEGTLRFSAVNSSSNSFTIWTGLPFAPANTTMGVARDDTTAGSVYVIRVNNTQCTLNSMDGINNGSQRTIRIDENYNFTATYFV